MANRKRPQKKKKQKEKEKKRRTAKKEKNSIGFWLMKRACDMAKDSARVWPYTHLGLWPNDDEFSA